MKKFEIWKRTDHDDEHGMLIPVDEIEQMIGAFGDASVYRLDEKATEERIAELNRMIEKWAREHGNAFHWWCPSDMKEFFEENGIKYKIHSDQYYPPSGKAIFYQGEFMNEDTLDTCPVYTWWNGSNWKQIERPDEYGEITELEYYEGAEECLDTWDGRNYTSGGTGLHHYITRLGEDCLLMIYRSQWHGDHTRAEILTGGQYAEYRKEHEFIGGYENGYCN